MRIFKLLLILLLLCTPVLAWENEEGTPATQVDILPLDKGFYTSAATVTGSVSAIPLFGIFEGRRSLAITNSSDFNSVYIVDSPSKDPVDAGYEILANSTFIMDIGSDITWNTVYASTSDSTISVSVSTVEIR